MIINSHKLALLFIERYKSKWDKGHPGVKSEIGTQEHELAYAYFQIRNKTKQGLGVEVMHKRVLEIGCGQGGVCINIAMNGAYAVTGIDVSDKALQAASRVKERFEADGLIRRDILTFEKAFAEELPFADESFDLIIADNVFEHVSDLTKTLIECKRVLKPEGIIYAPNFPSILSSTGPHLKYGSKIPWLHIFFTEKAICEAVYQRALKYPELKLFDYYGGLKDRPDNFRDIRPYKDLNYITHKKFKEAANTANLKIISMHSKRPRLGKAVIKFLPFLKRTPWDDIFSTGTAAKLQKQNQ